jgi:RecJ-like exonuclease
MACMCGDLYCWSCGPAQGNGHCEVCGSWTMDGGCENPEECDREARRIEKDMARSIEEMNRIVDCPTCYGTGSMAACASCDTCNGSGLIIREEGAA